MTQKLKFLINEMVQDIRKIYKINGPIDNLENIIPTLGGILLKTTDPDIEGIIKTSDDTFMIIIHVRSNASQELINGKIAHCLGHLFLHMGFQINEKLWNEHPEKFDCNKQSCEFEMIANYFGRAFMMPIPDYTTIMAKNTIDTMVNTKNIAKEFHVSMNTAILRGQELGYLCDGFM